jgi:large subunit ribosomal protein L7Ae
MGLERTVRVPLNINTNSAVLQQQLLNNRCGIPPKLSLFTQLLDKNTTHMLFRFANKYRPETRKDNRRRRKAKKAAAASSVAVNATDEDAIKALDKNKKGKAEALDPVAAYDQQAKNKTPYCLKYGMNHIAALAEKQMAQLVVISDDIEPPEVLVWLPALCRKNDVPCAIVKGSAQLGTLVNKRSATAVAFTKVREEEQVEFLRLVDLVTACYAHTNQQPARRAWMGGLRGFKNRVKVALRTAVAANPSSVPATATTAGASAAGATAAGATPIN